MNRYTLEGVSRKSGNDRTMTVEANSEAEAIAKGNFEGMMVARATVEVPEPQPTPAPQPTWKPGSALASIGVGFVLGGLIVGPPAVVGGCLGAAAAELSKGKRGGGVAVAGIIVSVVWLFGLMLYLFGQGR